MILLGEEQRKRNFKEFRVKIERGRTPIDSRRAYRGRYSYGYGDPVQQDFTLEEILSIIRSGDL